MKPVKKTWKSGGKIEFCYQIDYRHPLTKERHREIIRDPETDLPVKNKAEAELIASQFWANLNAKCKGSQQPTDIDKSLTLKTLLEVHRQREGKSEWTIQIEEKQARNINRIWPDRLYVEVTTKALEDYAKLRRTETDRKRPAKTPTILKELKLIRQAARWGSDQNLCPFPTFKLPSLKVIKRKPKAIRPEDLHALFEACGSDTDYLRQVTEVYYFTGLRRMELFRLDWSQVDLKRGTITFVTEKAGESDHRREDVVFLAARVVDLLKLRQKETGGKGLVFGVLENSYLRNGKPTFEPFDYRAKLKQVAKRHGIDSPILTVKTLRSSCATNLFEAGANAPEIVSHLRHRDGGKLLMEHYAHAHEKALRKATTALESLGHKKGTNDDPEPTEAKVVQLRTG